MPKCVVKSCPHATGQKSVFPNITLHGFPRSVPQIQAWLRLAGMDGEILREFTKMVMEDRHSDKFRMCSAHFTEDCYLMKGVRRVLKGGSLPTIFPKDAPIFDATLDPWVRRNNRRARAEDPTTDSAGDPPVWLRRCCCSCHRQPPPPRGNMVNASTQTDGSCFVFVLSGIPYTKPASHKTIGMDHDYDKSEELESSEDRRSTANATAAPPMIYIPDIKAPPSKDGQHEERSRQSRKFHTGVPDETGTNSLVSKSSPKEEEDFVLVRIKEEPLSDEENFPHLDISAPVHDTQSPSAHTEEESILFEEEPHPYEMDYTAVVTEENFVDPPRSELTKLNHPIQRLSTCVKEEPFSGEEHLHSDISTPTHGTQPTYVSIKEEPLSEEHFSNSSINTPKHCTQPLSVRIKEEPMSEEEHNPSPDLSIQTHQAQPKSVSRERCVKTVGHSQCASKKNDVFSDVQLKNNSSRCKGVSPVSSRTTCHPSTEITVSVNNCSKCEEIFTSPQELSQHYWIHHAKLSGIKDRSELLCLRCDMKFERMEEMRAHWRIHPLTCQYCGKSYKSLYYLSKHEVMHKVNPCSCHDCEKCLANPPFLQIHHETEKISDGPEHDQNVLTDSEPTLPQQVHPASKLITCESQVAENLFEGPETDQNVLKNSKSVLQQQVHTAPKSIICFTCGKCFKDQHRLPEHELHEDGKIRPCPQCAKRFSSYGRVTRRKRVCQERKITNCRECRRKFVTRGQMLIHLAIVHQKCPISCAKCGKCFRNKLGLMAHKKIRHSLCKKDPKLSRKSQPLRGIPL